MNKIYLKKSDVFDILDVKLKGKFKRGINRCRTYLADNNYYAPPLEDVKRILDETNTNVFKWTAESFDCDDFAKVLCAEFAKDAYKNGIRRPPYCLGFVWGMFPNPHAINWFIDSTGEFFFIEPQSDYIFLPREADKGIWLIVA